MALKLFLLCITVPQILSLPVPSTYDYQQDVNYVNLDNTFMSKPAYDYTVQYQHNPHSTNNFHAQMPTYLRHDLPTYHIFKPEYPPSLYPLHTVFFVTANGNVNQGIRPQPVEEEQYDFPNPQYDPAAEGQHEAPKFHVTAPVLQETRPVNEEDFVMPVSVASSVGNNAEAGSTFPIDNKNWEMPRPVLISVPTEMTDNVNTNVNMNMNNHYGSRPPSSEAGSTSSELLPVIENENVNSQSGEVNEMPTMGNFPISSSVLINSNENGNGNFNKPIDVPQIPGHFQTLLNSDIQTHEPFPSEEVPKSESSSLMNNNKEDDTPEDSPVGELMTGEDNEQQVSDVASDTTVTETVTKQDGVVVEDEIMMTTESNTQSNVNAEVVEDAHTHVQEFDATTEPIARV